MKAEISHERELALGLPFLSVGALHHHLGARRPVMRFTLAILNLLSVLLTACATTQQPVRPERRNELRSMAQECMRAHPEIEGYEVDRFGYVTAIYRGPGRATTEPFFDCVFRRK
jgi:hypothetical protein